MRQAVLFVWLRPKATGKDYYLIKYETELLSAM